MFSKVDYRGTSGDQREGLNGGAICSTWCITGEALGFQHVGVEGRPQVFTVVNYRRCPRCSGWWIVRKACFSA